MKLLDCAYGTRCGGCPWIAESVEIQRKKKQDALSTIIDGARIEWRDCGLGALRDRFDLTWEKIGEQSRLGLYQLGGAREILDLETCPMLSPALLAFYKIYRGHVPPINRGSVRLRVAPSGQAGVWLDFANADVKALFEEKIYLQWLSQIAIVEIGQRKKRLHWAEGAPKLRDPELFSWFETINKNGKAIPLYGTISGFTQTGLGANRVLVSEVLAQVEFAKNKKWLELFAGSGNFSLALASSGYDLRAVELDEQAVAAMRRSALEQALTLEILRQDLYHSSEGIFDDDRAWLLDPPRSGIKNLLSEVERVRPPCLIYVSCWTDSFVADAKALQALGYRISRIVGVDQFVHSAHAEWVATFSRD